MRWEYVHLVWQSAEEGGRVTALVFSHRPRWDLSENPSLAAVLRLLGDDGWEMVSLSTTATVAQAERFHVLYLFKRPAPAPAPNGAPKQLPALPADLPVRPAAVPADRPGGRSASRHRLFTELLTNRSGRIRDGQIGELPVLPAGQNAFGVAIDPSGAVWLTTCDGRLLKLPGLAQAER